MSNFSKMFDNQAVNAKWETDLTDWLAKCKGIPNVTKQDLAQWDAILNGTPSFADLQSFCNHTGWKYGR